MYTGSIHGLHMHYNIHATSVYYIYIYIFRVPYKYHVYIPTYGINIHSL